MYTTLTDLAKLPRMDLTVSDSIVVSSRTWTTGLPNPLMKSPYVELLPGGATMPLLRACWSLVVLREDKFPGPQWTTGT